MSTFLNRPASYLEAGLQAPTQTHRLVAHWIEVEGVETDTIYRPVIYGRLVSITEQTTYAARSYLTNAATL